MMTFSYGALAALIAAAAFLILVLFMIPMLVRTAKTLKTANKTIETANESLSKISADTEDLMKQTNELLAKTNDLMDDVNGKLKTIDPVVQAAADLGTSVSKLNDSSQRAVKRFSSWHSSKTGLVSAALATLLARRKRRRGEN
jgi:uncharacterized protein YoxC